MAFPADGTRADIGSPGAGKSTLAAEVARRTGLPLVHLDRLYWRAGWVESDKAEFVERVRETVAAPRWVIDGNYGGTLPIRLERADTVLWLDFRSGSASSGSCGAPCAIAAGSGPTWPTAARSR